MKRRELDSRLLILVTLALVAFGLVMVYSATSAAAAVGGRDPIYYLKRQAVFAVLGLIGLIVATRTSYRALRGLGPSLLVGSLFLLACVLVIGERVNGARRWIAVGPATFQPSELAKLALVIWAAAYLARRSPPSSLSELGKPIGVLVGVFGLLLLLEPDLGTAIVLVMVLAAMLLVSGSPLGVLCRAGAIVTAAGLLAIWVEPYRRGGGLSFFQPLPH